MMTAAGRPFAAWVALFRACHRANVLVGLAPALMLEQWCWPDGGAVLAQPRLLHEVFDILRDEAQAAFAARTAGTG